MMNNRMRATLLSMVGVLCIASAHAAAQDKVYSTPAVHPIQVYFGDPHIHTSISADAAMWGNTLSLDETYKFGRGG